MIKLYSPENESELALLKSLLEAEGIHYYVLNDHFGSLRVGPKIDLFNEKSFTSMKNFMKVQRNSLTIFTESIKDESRLDQAMFILEKCIKGLFFI